MSEKPISPLRRRMTRAALSAIMLQIASALHPHRSRCRYSGLRASEVTLRQTGNGSCRLRVPENLCGYLQTMPRVLR